jgi:hypothetical protein
MILLDRFAAIHPGNLDSRPTEDSACLHLRLVKDRCGDLCSVDHHNNYLWIFVLGCGDDSR